MGLGKKRRGSKRMKKNERIVWGGLVILLVICYSVFAQTAEEILEKVDGNTVVGSARYQAKMVISLGGTIREKEFSGYAKGKEFAYMEFTSPARDKGTRFLKIGDEMWIYLPSVEKATKIAGHMLRQSMMGSDFSYDDVAQNERLLDLYEAELVGTDSIDGKACYAVELVAKVKEVSYYSRRIWVTKESYIPLREELFAKSGKLMKEITVSEFEKIGAHNYPTRVKMVNKLRKDTYTELILEEVELDVTIPSKIFSKSYLERK
jgi:outer membrane lipoprotein-sorting protein